MNDSNTSVETHTHYLDGFQYTDDHLDFFPHAEGYVNVTHIEEEKAFNYVYTYRDHLNNIRLRYAFDEQADGLAILEEDNYYPFGLKHKGYNTGKYAFDFQPEEGFFGIAPVTPENKEYFNYKFGGMEYQDEFSIGLYDFGARNYDPALGRWMNVDPLADHPKQVGFSPYIYAANNPIYFIDPDGRLFDTYGLNSKGEVTHIDDKKYYDEQGNEVDRLYNEDQSSYVEVSDKNLLSQFSQERTIGGQNASYAVVGSESLGDAANFFEFAVVNTDVEFGLDVFRDGGDINIAVHTKHEFGSSINFQSNYQDFGIGELSNSSFLVSIHSHKGGEITPSNRINSNGIPYGDLPNARALNGSHRNLSMFIYHPNYRGSKILNQYMHFGSVMGNTGDQGIKAQPHRNNILGGSRTLSSQIRRYGKF